MKPDVAMLHQHGNVKYADADSPPSLIYTITKMVLTYPLLMT